MDELTGGHKLLIQREAKNAADSVAGKFEKTVRRWKLFAGIVVGLVMAGFYARSFLATDSSRIDKLEQQVKDLKDNLHQCCVIIPREAKP